MAKRAIKKVDAHVARRLRERRKEIGMSQEELEEKLCMPFQQVQRYETGTTRIGSSWLVQIANALDVSPTYFFEDAPTAVRLIAGYQNQMQYIADFVASKEGHALIKAFARLPNDVQRRVVKLVETIAKNE